MMLRNFIGKNTTLTIGMNYLGGKIAYLDSSGIHGFVSDPSDQSGGIQWINGTYISVNTTNNPIESVGVYGITKSEGRRNTDLIISAQGVGTYAASICANLTIGGASVGDWYLPSVSEFAKIWINRGLLGSFSANFYWTSCQWPGEYQLAHSISNGTDNMRYKTQYDNVRAIRAF